MNYEIRVWKDAKKMPNVEPKATKNIVDATKNGEDKKEAAEELDKKMKEAIIKKFGGDTPTTDTPTTDTSTGDEK